MAEDATPRSSHQNLDNKFGKGSHLQKTDIELGVEHFTRRSQDNIKNMLRAILDKIKEYNQNNPIDKSEDVKAYADRYESLISKKNDNDDLNDIKIILNKKLLKLEIADTKYKAHATIDKIISLYLKNKHGQDISTWVDEQKNYVTKDRERNNFLFL